LKSIVNDFAESEASLKTGHLEERAKLERRFEIEMKSFKGSVKLNSIKKKVVGLMRLRLYEEAEFEAASFKHLEAEELKSWDEKIDNKKKHAF
jgi:hypothetical protein